MSLILPRLIGHRGLAAHAPENTLSGFRAAHAAGVTMVEFDAKLTGDDIPVLFHDDTLDRTTDGHGNVRDLTLEQLRKCDAGKWFGPNFVGERIPTMIETLDLCSDLGIAVNIEIKPCPGRAKQTAANVLEVARHHWQGDRPAPLISSFDPDCLIAAREIAPDWPRGYLIDIRPENWRTIINAVEPATLNIGDTRWSPNEWADYRGTGLPILVYTVNDVDRAKLLIDQGATSLISDDPALLAASLNPN